MLLLSPLSTALLFSFSSGIPAGVQAAHSRHRARYVVQKENQFDRGTTKFTEQGRLLQVEYGLEAAERASTAAVINLENEEEEEGNGDMIGSFNAILIMVKKWDKVYKIDDHVWMVSTGVVGDASFMAQYLREFCQDFIRSYGESPTIREVAQRAAQVQHSLTMRDAYRPLGCTAFLLGVDPHSTKQRVFRTDPGGMLEECRFCVAGKNQAVVMKDLAKEFPKIIEKAKRNRFLDALKAAINSLHLGNEETVDVWYLRVAPGTTQDSGALQAQCFLNVDKQNCNKIQIEA